MYERRDAISAEPSSLSAWKVVDMSQQLVAAAAAGVALAALVVYLNKRQNKIVPPPPQPDPPPPSTPEPAPPSPPPLTEPATPPMPTAAAPPPAPAIDDAAAAQKALASTIETTLAQLRPTKAGTDERKHLVEALHEALTDVSGRTGKQQRALVRAFVDSDGPEIVYEMESSMTGNWMVDAKNGTMKRLSSIGRLPGPIGQAVCAYRRVAEKNKLDAAHGMGCGIPHDQGEGQS